MVDLPLSQKIHIPILLRENNTISDYTRNTFCLVILMNAIIVIFKNVILKCENETSVLTVILS